jgi:hypothetical protein
MVSLDPVRGAESNKIRPVVVVSNDGANTLGSPRSVVSSWLLVKGFADTGLRALDPWTT